MASTVVVKTCSGPEGLQCCGRGDGLVGRGGQPGAVAVDRQQLVAVAVHDRDPDGAGVGLQLRELDVRAQQPDQLGPVEHAERRRRLGSQPLAIGRRGADGQRRRAGVRDVLFAALVVRSAPGVRRAGGFPASRASSVRTGIGVVAIRAADTGVVATGSVQTGSVQTGAVATGAVRSGLVGGRAGIADGRQAVGGRRRRLRPGEVARCIATAVPGQTVRLVAGQQAPTGGATVVGAGEPPPTGAEAGDQQHGRSPDGQTPSAAATPFPSEHPATLPTGGARPPRSGRPISRASRRSGRAATRPPGRPARWCGAR